MHTSSLESHQYKVSKALNEILTTTMRRRCATVTEFAAQLVPLVSGLIHACPDEAKARF